MDFETKFGLGIIAVWLAGVLVTGTAVIAAVVIVIHFIHKLW